MAKLKEEYNNRIVGELEQKLGSTNRMLVPRLQKIVVNMGFGIVSKDEQKGIVDDLTAITGQRPLLCKAKKSISNFKLREGMVIGAKVTLRGDRMWDFAERLINANLTSILQDGMNYYFETYLAGAESGLERHYAMYYYSGALVNIYTLWIARGLSEPPEYVANVIYDIVKK